MRIAFFVNSIEGETANYSTTHLALAALDRGHDICYLTPGDFVLRPDDSLAVRALTLPSNKYKKAETLFEGLQSKETTVETIDVADLDILLLRNDPSRMPPTGPGRRMSAPCSDAWRLNAGSIVAQRSRWPGPGAEQALLPGISRLGASGNPDLQEHRGNPRLHREPAARA